MSKDWVIVKIMILIFCIFVGIVVAGEFLKSARADGEIGIIEWQEQEKKDHPDWYSWSPEQIAHFDSEINKVIFQLFCLKIEGQRFLDWCNWTGDFYIPTCKFHEEFFGRDIEYCKD